MSSPQSNLQSTLHSTLQYHIDAISREVLRSMNIISKRDMKQDLNHEQNNNEQGGYTFVLHPSVVGTLSTFLLTYTTTSLPSLLLSLKSHSNTTTLQGRRRKVEVEENDVQWVVRNKDNGVYWKKWRMEREDALRLKGGKKGRTIPVGVTDVSGVAGVDRAVGRKRRRIGNELMSQSQSSSSSGGGGSGSEEEEEGGEESISGRKVKSNSEVAKGDKAGNGTVGKDVTCVEGGKGKGEIINLDGDESDSDFDYC